MSARFESLTDTGVVITGGATGIGAAIVTEFARQGARVGFIDIDEPAANALTEELSNKGVRHRPTFSLVDLTNAGAIAPAVSALCESLGGIGALINNAANDERHAYEDVTPSFWRDRMAVNLDHQFFVTQAVVPFLEAAGGGAIVNMGSCSWRLGLGGMTAYVTAKAAIEGLTNGMARDLGPKRIRVNCIVPGFVRTQRQIDKWLTPELEETIFAGQCLPDFVEPEHVAQMAAFLCSDAARSCTSGTYAVDAGWI